MSMKLDERKYCRNRYISLHLSIGAVFE
ncbi:Protein of unknown function [Bacillus cereus]|nr:Protein of unknown function [Bacillus cereus]SCL91386.1 Protein of unknown function [Bacillus wiedmannii]SCN07045.1 Protein of unknown function [Bacillus wiedmannii]SCN33262.1 Protein of unknown function [Bacillus wiedmannii]